MIYLLLSCFACLSITALTAYELSIAALFRNEGAYLKEWIEYHKMVGVEHFWLYNNASTDDWEEILQPYIAEGTVEVTHWEIPISTEREKYQERAYIDVLNKAKGVTKWLALIDLDEYLLPMKEATLTECLENHFSDASAIYVNWRCFGTGGVTLKAKESCLFRLTACSKPLHSINANGKSIVRPECVELPFPFEGEGKAVRVHHFPLKSAIKYHNGDGREIPMQGERPQLDGHAHTGFIRLNHYMMRDEYFFHNIKFERNKQIAVPNDLAWEHYHAFNLDQDETMIRFIKEKHPDMYEKFWKNPIFN